MHDDGKKERRPLEASLRVAAGLALVLLAAACSEPTTPDPSEPVEIALEPVIQGLTEPLYLTAPAGDTERLLIVQRGGLVRIVKDGAVLAAPFLDLRGSVTTLGGEQGLHSIAFHPQHAINGYVYASYTNTQGDTRIVRYTVSANRDQVAPASADTVLAVEQPYVEHNSGLVSFGPGGYLYVGLGDGGSAGDPDGHAQNLTTLLGSLLRLRVDAGSPYTIPAGNPFVGQSGARPETWAYGLRNPWRFSFDRATGDLYIADVGQGEREEVNFQPGSSPGGENYGWPIMEASACFEPPNGCTTTGLTLPLYQYSHAEGCSVIGGYVYRGSDYPALRGRYFFSDFCGGWIRSFAISNGVAVGIQDHTDDVGTIPHVSSFGEDGVGELYVLSLDGAVYRVTAP